MNVKKKFMKLFDECLMNIRSLKLRVRNFFSGTSKKLIISMCIYIARLRRGGQVGRLYIIIYKITANTINIP